MMSRIGNEGKNSTNSNVLNIDSMIKGSNDQKKTSFTVKLECHNDDSEMERSTTRAKDVHVEQAQIDTTNIPQWNKLAHSANDLNVELKSYRKLIVVLAAVFSGALTGGFPLSMSVFYVEWLHEFRKSNSETAVVQSVCLGFFAVGGAISGIMVTKYGPRVCTIASGMLAAVGVAASYFATNILQLMLTISVLTGSACSLGFAASLASVGMYFKGRMKLMMFGFIVFGSGCGVSILTILSQFLVNEYGWRGTVLIVAGIMLNITVTGCLLHVPSNHILNKNRKKETKIIYKKGDNDLLQTPSTSSVIETRASSPEQDITSDNSEINKHTINNDVVLQIVRNLMKNYGFIIFCFVQAGCVAVFNSTFIFLIDYYERKGFTRSDGVHLYFYMNMVGTASRLLPGFLIRLPHVSTFSIPAFGALIGGTSLALFQVTGRSFSLNLVSSCFYGIALSFIRTGLPMAIQKLVGANNYSIGFGISLTLTGIFNIAAGPISGFVRDKTENDDIFLCSSAATLLLSSISFFILIYCRHNAKNANNGTRTDARGNENVNHMP